MKLTAAFPATAWALHNNTVLETKTEPKYKMVKEARLNLCGLHFFSHEVKKEDGFKVGHTFHPLNLLNNVLKKGLTPITTLMDVVSLVYKNTIGFLIQQIAKVFSSERKPAAPVAPVTAKKTAKAKAPVAAPVVAKAPAKKAAVIIKA
jgi:hypothetical protein